MDLQFIKPRSCRPRILKKRDLRTIMKNVKANPRISAPKLAEEIQQITQKAVHAETVPRMLRCNGFNSS